MRDTLPLLRQIDFPALTRGQLQTLQLNLGYRCNLSCIHCHVNAGPTRRETMSRETMQLALAIAERQGAEILDLTGGSPEMNTDFQWLVVEARKRGLHVMDRLNATLVEEPGYEWIPAFLAEHDVEIVASLPCYSQKNVDEQRGNGVFESSIRVLQQLNTLGYGQGADNRRLNLVYNPNGAFLPPNQSRLEEQYKSLLGDNFGIRFDHLYALANMPIKRFGSWLLSKGQFETYMGTLKAAHRDENLDSVMCRTTISVDPDGYVYDCDFNQMLGLQLTGSHGPRHLRDLLNAPLTRSIAVAGHCFGCTAGQGSSCGGATTTVSSLAA